MKEGVASYECRYLHPFDANKTSLLISSVIGRIQYLSVKERAKHGQLLKPCFQKCIVQSNPTPVGRQIGTYFE